MSNTSIVPSETGSSIRPGYNAYADLSQGHTDAMHPLKMLHLFLRGHYLLLIFLIAVLTPLGAWLGYKFGKTDYLTTGEIRVHPTIPHILYVTQENDVPAMFDQFLDAECSSIKNQRVLDFALADPEWRTWKSPLPDNFETTLQEELAVTHTGVMIHVAVADPDKTAALLAVKTVLAAYHHLYQEDQNLQDETRDSALDDRQHKLESDLKTVREDILQEATHNDYGTDDLEEAAKSAEKQVELIKLELQQANFALIHNGPTVTNTPDSDAAELDKIAHENPKMAQAIQERDGWTEKLADYDLSNLMANNDVVIYAHKRLDRANADIQKYKLAYEHETALNEASQALTPAPTTRPIQEVIARLNDELLKQQTGLQEINKKRLALTALKQLEAEKVSKLEEVNNAIDQIQTEHATAISGRMEVTNTGTLATGPHSDTHAAMGAVGGFGGMSLGVLFVALLGLRDRRFHGPEDTQFSAVRCPMLGMLPTLSSDLSDTEQAAMAAHFVHGIRAMLQIKGSNPQGGRVLAITSPSAHNGKTSLSLALGVSFAGAHSKTLLIDCDFIGRALSERINAVARPRLGRILRHQGVIDEDKLQEGLDAAERHGRRLGEALIDMGHLSVAKLEAALAAQKDRAFGIVEAIDGEELIECVAPTAIPGLSILPLGQASPEHIGSLSPAMLQQVLDATRQQYDIIIVDTGPILGSLEASMVATQADDVVLVLSNGENRATAERSLRYLEMVGAKIAGFVFNRATPRDFMTSDSAQHVSNSADRWRHARNWNKSTTNLDGFGPVATAVARSVSEVEGRGHGGGFHGVEANTAPANGAAANEVAGDEPHNGDGHNGHNHPA